MSESAEATFLSQTGMIAQSLIDFGNPSVVAESLFLFLAATTVAIVQNVSGDGDGRADALLSAILVFRCLSGVAPVDRHGNLPGRGVAAAIGAVLCAGLIATTLGLWNLALPAYLTPRLEERILPIAAVLVLVGSSAEIAAQRSCSGGIFFSP